MNPPNRAWIKIIYGIVCWEIIQQLLKINRDIITDYCPSDTSLKLHKIFVAPKIVKKIIMKLDLSKASGPDYIPVVVLKNCEPKLSYILAELFNKYLREFCFPDCWKVSSVVPVFKNVGEWSTAKSYHLPSVVRKVFEKLVNNRIVNHLEKCRLFLIYSMVLGLLDQL